MYYQTYRSKIIGKGTKGYFSRAEFDQVMKVPDIEPATDKPLGNVVGSENINQYLCAIRYVLDAHQRHGLIIIQRQDIMSDSMKSLVKLVVVREERVMKDFLKERVDV